MHPSRGSRDPPRSQARPPRAAPQSASCGWENFVLNPTAGTEWRLFLILTDDEDYSVEISVVFHISMIRDVNSLCKNALGIHTNLPRIVLVFSYEGFPSQIFHLQEIYNSHF